MLSVISICLAIKGQIINWMLTAIIQSSNKRLEHMVCCRTFDTLIIHFYVILVNDIRG